MKIYADLVFPRLMDWVMSGEVFQRLRAQVLKDVHGEVLEIGFGTGLNLPHYPQHISGLSIADPAPMLPDRVKTRIAQIPFPVHVEHVTAETLHYPAQQFDSVVSTWTLCTISDVERALKEIRRVLKPTGTFFFLEHGRSDNARIAVWQDRLNPIQNIIGCGCNLNRRIDQLIMKSGLQMRHLDRFTMEHVPRIAGEMYRGQAVPTSGP